MRPTGWGRLTLAGLLCVLALGLPFDRSPYQSGYLTPGMVLPTTTVSAVTGDLSYSTMYVPGTYVAGFGGYALPGYQSDVRVVLVAAAAVLLWAASRRTPRTRRAARGAVIGLSVAALLAISRGRPGSALVVGAATWLAASVAWPRLTDTIAAWRPKRHTAVAPDPSYVGPF